MNRYVIACVNANGESDFFFCTAKDYIEAERKASREGCDEPFIVYDKHDRCFSGLETLFNWELLT